MRKIGVERPRPRHYLVESERQELEAVDLDLQERRWRIERQDRILTQLSWIFTVLIVFALIIFVLHGFQLGGFSLEENLLIMLGAATFGEVVGLLAIVYRAVFRMQDQ